MHHESMFQIYKAQTEACLRDLYKPAEGLPQQVLIDSMKYSLLAGGKRLRPILVCEFARLSGGDWTRSLSYACAIEMIHTYSLIHDDLPCMDNDDFRRGIPTNHKIYGEAIAVLAGDALLTDAFQTAVCADVGDPSLNVQAVKVLSEAAGSLGMVGGQVLDILSEERICSEREVLEIQSRKTGRLIRAACMLGVISAGADAGYMKSAVTFADNLGLAFQIRDDVLDVIGNAKELGKSTGTDAEKNTFVRLYGLDTCEQLIAQYTENAVRALDVFDDTEELSALAYSLTKRMS